MEPGRAAIIHNNFTDVCNLLSENADPHFDTTVMLWDACALGRVSIAKHVIKDKRCSFSMEGWISFTMLQLAIINACRSVNDKRKDYTDICYMLLDVVDPSECMNIAFLTLLKISHCWRKMISPDFVPIVLRLINDPRTDWRLLCCSEHFTSWVEGALARRTKAVEMSIHSLAKSTHAPHHLCLQIIGAAILLEEEVKLPEHPPGVDLIVFARIIHLDLLVDFRKVLPCMQHATFATQGYEIGEEEQFARASSEAMKNWMRKKCISLVRKRLNELL